MTITTYGLFAALSLALLLLSAGLWYRRKQIGYSIWIRLCVLATPLALICSRALFSVFAMINGDFSAPVQALYFQDGGASITGALIGIIIAAAITSRFCNTSCADLLDGIALGAPVALMVERLAEYPMDMGVGRPVDTELLYFLGSAFDDRHPVFLYEAIIALVILLVLLFTGLRKSGRKHSGDLMLLFMTLYGTTQVFMESLRDDAHMVIYFIRINQITALSMAVIAFAIWMVRWGRKGVRPFKLVLASLLVVAGIALGIVQEFAVDSNPNLLFEYSLMALALALIASVTLVIRKKAN